MSKKVSVLLSIYKVEEYLEECLDSILAQSYTNLEIVCVDNGSPDSCGEILKKYAIKDKRIKIVTLKENKFLCGGRNAGLDNATGDFICFVDPDDWIEKNYIKTMVNVIENIKDPDGNKLNLVLNSNAVCFSNLTKKVMIDCCPPQNFVGFCSVEKYNSYVITECFIPMWGRLYRKSFLEQWNVRFLDGFQTDNIPYVFKLMVHLKYWYCIKGEKNATYWRRMITKDGAITADVLYKNLEIPDTFDNLYDYLVKYGAEQKIKIPFYHFFTSCFPRHIDKPRYYQKFRDLMVKMEDVIKTSGIYTKEDINLCNLLIYSNGYYDFLSLCFNPARRSTCFVNTSYIVKLFDLVPIMKIYQRANKIKYSLFKMIPIFEQKKKGDSIYYKLFGLPLFKIKKHNEVEETLFHPKKFLPR